jgi:hypothetical protein
MRGLLARARDITGRLASIRWAVGRLRIERTDRADRVELVERV